MKKQIVTDVEQNPFEGLKTSLSLLKSIQSGGIDSLSKRQVFDTLSTVKTELNTNLSKDIANQMLWTLIISAGDVTNREHTILKGAKTEKGGFGRRKFFSYAMQWLLSTRENVSQFFSMLDIISEFTNFENVILNNIRTERFKGTLIEENFLGGIDYKELGKTLGEAVKSGEINGYSLSLLAKFLPKIPSAARTKKNKAGETVSREKQLATKEKDKRSFQLIIGFSDEMELETRDHETHVDYKGYRNWRSNLMNQTEAVLFSTNKIVLMDKFQFINWLESLPAGARYRVQRRLFEKDEQGNLKALDKWKLSSGENMSTVYTDLMKEKEQAMKKLVSMTDEDKKGMLKSDLRKLEKAAKVTTGGLDLFDSFVELLNNPNSSESNVLAQTIVDKVKSQVPVLLFSDISGSMAMDGMAVEHNGRAILPSQIASFLTTLFLYKNADLDAGQYFFLFENELHTITEETVIKTRENRYTSQNVKKVGKLIRTTEPFLDNWNRVRPIVEATRGGTSVSRIATDLKIWLNADPQLTSLRKEIISNYPVWLIISDGEFNNNGTPKASLQAMKHVAASCGIDPVIVIWDVTRQNKHTNFDDMENVVHLAGFNAEILNNVFTNVTNYTFIDVYLPLKTLFESNRYQVVRDRVSMTSKATSTVIEQ